MRAAWACLTGSCLLAAVWPARAGELVNAPAVRVNTQSISLREVEAVFSDSHVLIQDKLRRGELAPAGLEAAIRTAWSEALETATQDAIIDQRADKERKRIKQYYLDRIGSVSTGERAMQAFKRTEDDYVRRLRRELVTAAGGEDELRAALKRRGQTLLEWEEGLPRELFRRDVLALELGPVTVPPSAVREFFDAHPELFRQEEAWRLRRVRVLKSKFSSPAVALDAAKMVKDKAGKGGDFGQLAATISDDPQYAAEGGLLSKDGKTDLPSGNFPDEELIAAALKDGEISAPLDRGEWYVLVQRAGYRPRTQQPFEKASERAEALAFAEKLRQKKRELFEKLKHESYVEIIQKEPPAHLLQLARRGTGAAAEDFTKKIQFINPVQ